MRVFKPVVVVAFLALPSMVFAAEMKITVLYKQPKSTAEFDEYYFNKHMPMVYSIKEIKKVEIARPTASPNPSPYHVITELWFDSPEALEKVSMTEEWKAIVADVPKFAEANDVTILVSRIEPKK